MGDEYLPKFWQVYPSSEAGRLRSAACSRSPSPSCLEPAHNNSRFARTDVLYKRTTRLHAPKRDNDASCHRPASTRCHVDFTLTWPFYAYTMCVEVSLWHALAHARIPMHSTVDRSWHDTI